MISLKKLLLTAIVSVMAVYASAQTGVLVADGTTDTYSLMATAGYDRESPDVVPGYTGSDHTSSNPVRHIVQQFDTDLNKYVFKFIIHVTPDDESANHEKTDRQRNEMKTPQNSALNAWESQTFEYRWKFKLPAGFKTTTKFTHIHQIKGIKKDGNTVADVDQPLITFTCCNKDNGDQVFRLRYCIRKDDGQITLKEVSLDDFLDEWVEVFERITYSSDNATADGQYSVTIRRISDGKKLFEYNDDAVRLFCYGCDGMRPKWGIYRSFGEGNTAATTPLRDEEVLFADFITKKITTPTPAAEQYSLPDIGNESVVAKETTWTFTPSSGIETGTVYNYNGLYVRGVDEIPTTTNGQASFGNERVPVSHLLQFRAASDLTGGITSGTTAGSSDDNDHCLALNIGVPGILYFHYRINNGDKDDTPANNKVTLFDNGVAYSMGITSTSSNGNVHLAHSYRVSAPGTIYLTCNRKYFIYGVKFVPYVCATTLWKFSEYYNWDGSNAHAPVTVAGNSATVNYDGLYLHTSSSATTVTGVEYKDSNVGASGISLVRPIVRLQFSGSNGTVGTELAHEPKAIDGIAFTADRAGTVYILARGTSSTGRSLNLYFDGELVRSRSYTDATFYTLFYHNETQGTYYFKGSSNAWNVAAVYFVPDVEQPMARSVSIGSTGWATFSASQNYDLPEGLKAYYVKSYSGGKAILQEISDIPNNTGVLLEGTPNTEYTLTSKAAANSTVENNMLVANVGVFNLPQTMKKRVSDTSSDEYINHILVSDNGVAKYGRTSGTGTLGGNKSFLQIQTDLLPANSQNAKIAFGLFEDVTGIDNVNKNDNENANDNAIYDLSGRKVADLSSHPIPEQSSPTRSLSSLTPHLSKGIYIINGKKIVIK